MTEEVYLLLGSNVGDRDSNLSRAIERISQSAGELLKVSRIYETAAWGKIDQASFLNQAVYINTAHAPLELLTQLKNIEKEVGRVSTEKWGPRVIDIDILFYGSEIIQSPQLQVPHPYMPVRRFALLPLAEVTGDFMHPVLRKSVSALLTECPDVSDVRLYK